MTMADALQIVEGLRGASLGKNGWKAWMRALDGFTPEEIVDAAEKVSDDWAMASPWQIGLLRARLMAIRGEMDRGDVDGVAYDCANATMRGLGRWAGRESEYWKTRPDTEREQIAEYTLGWGQSPEHIAMAETICTGSYERWYRKHSAQNGDSRPV
jgi:hypothetical protein